MTATYRTMTLEHLGDDATEGDLVLFTMLCREVKSWHPEMSDEEVAAAVAGDGDWVANARRLGATLPVG